MVERNPNVIQGAFEQIRRSGERVGAFILDLNSVRHLDRIEEETRSQRQYEDTVSQELAERYQRHE